MLTDAITAMFPAILAIALTPIQLVGAVLVLGGSHARTSGMTFLIGWLLGLTVVTVVIILIIEKLGEGGRASSPLLHWLQLVVGLLLLWMALRLFRGRPRGGIEPEPPKWLASIGEAGPMRAFAVGASMAVANPKIVALVVAAMTSLVYLALSAGQVATVVLVFVMLGSSPIIAIVAAHRIGREAMGARIEALKRFLLRNNNLILAVVFAMLGVGVLGNGIAGLQ